MVRRKTEVKYDLCIVTATAVWALTSASVLPATTFASTPLYNMWSVDIKKGTWWECQKTIRLGHDERGICGKIDFKRILKEKISFITKFIFKSMWWLGIPDCLCLCCTIPWLPCVRRRRIWISCRARLHFAEVRAENIIWLQAGWGVLYLIWRAVLHLIWRTMWD